MIPRIIHRIWIGPKPLPADFKAYGETWRTLHPEWEMKLWTDESLVESPIKPVADKFADFSSQSNVYRFWIIHEFGGIYVDTDMECQKPFDELLQLPAFVGQESGKKLGTAIFGAIPKHPWTKWLVNNVPVGRAAPWGPSLITSGTRKFPEVKVFPQELFYPYLWYQRPKERKWFPQAMAVHHWSMLWTKHHFNKLG